MSSGRLIKSLLVEFAAKENLYNKTINQILSVHL